MKYIGFSKFLLVGMLIYLGWVNDARALTFNLPSGGDSVVGHVQWTQAMPGDTFSDIGRRYDVGYYQLVEANPGVNPDQPQPGSIIVVPTRFILPPVPRRGVVVNLAELRVYYYPPNTNQVMTFPIGIGREGWDTPVGVMHIIEKTVNPTWNVPQSIRDDRAKEEVFLPKSVPPGPDNPLGGYRMRLSKPTYLVHGTNDYRGVGRRSSSGCLRLYPEDIETLFERVKVGTPVTIVDMSYKTGWEGGKLYFEAHVPLQEQQGTSATDPSTVEEHVRITAARNPHASVDWDRVKQIFDVQNGVPQVVAG